MNILITGGSAGMGREAALCLAENKNNHILLTGRNIETLKEVASVSKNNNISYFVIDFSGLKSQKDDFVDYIGTLFSGIDILINNAGYLVNKRFEELGEHEIKLMMEINFFAPASLIRLLLPFMKKGSHIVNISSMGGFQGSVKYSGLSCYSASKAAIATLSECLATEFSEKGISVNCLAPGSVQTEMFRNAFPGYTAPVTAEEMGQFIAYFALNGNKFFNGKILPVALSNP
jgi:NAD(P)-dependent dehydrogenase (short-subunit alcohol dehydrogenase family)